MMINQSQLNWCMTLASLHKMETDSLSIANEFISLGLGINSRMNTLGQLK